MSNRGITESVVEQATLAWLESLNWQIAHGPDIAPDGPNPQRTSYDQVILETRLRDALATLNPDLPVEALEDAFRKLTHPEGPTLEARNRAFHRMLVDGVTVEYQRADGSIAGAQARVIDFDKHSANDFLAINQFTVTENRHTRRPDIVLFVNGLPLGVIELKNPTGENATLQAAHQQLQTYKNEVPSLFQFNEVLAVSDGLEARIGTLTAGWEWFKPWRTIAGEIVEDDRASQLEVLLKGVFDPGRLLSLIRDFVVFEDEDDGRLVKKMAGYHQFHAVQVAVAETLRAATLGREIREAGGRYEARPQAGGQPGDRRIGVVWHTQGSGKSLTMAFYAGRIIREPAMDNPTVVVLTDRNDLDDQLFATFSRCQDLLRQPPVQAESRRHLREFLRRQAGGVIFTTLQKFLPDQKGDPHPCLSERRNIVVIADEAHRSQYDFIDGFARHLRDALPKASFIGFTGTPIEKADANTRAVFGDYISIYDIQRAVEDGATVPIYYESRLAKLTLDESEKPHIDPEFEEVTEGEETEGKEKLKSKWAQLEAVVGSKKRLQLVAKDIVEHFQKRQEALAGKGMIVCMSRRICVELYHEIKAIKPEWFAEHDADDESGQVKVVMTGSASDPKDWQPHIRTKAARERLAKRFRDPGDPFKLVIVRDMWLTGFDCPSLHTLYLDKPMRGHNLMQAIARVNRVFRDKPGGLVVDYIGLAAELKQALATYTESGGKGDPVIDQEEALAVFKEKYEICCGLLHGFDWQDTWTRGDATQRLDLIRKALDHILAQEDGKERFLKAVQALSKAFALATPSDEALALRDDVAFFQALQGALTKRRNGQGKDKGDVEQAVRQIVEKAIVPGEVVDIFAAAGLDKPDISILSDEFLAEVRGTPYKNLAIEALKRLLEGKIKKRRRKNVVQSRSFAELLEKTMRRYHNRAIEAAQVIEELIDLAKEINAAAKRGESLGLSEDELAFYDALGTNDSAVQVLGDDTLRTIARELVKTVRNNVTIDWTVRENVRANLRRLVKRILRKYGYPPDKQEQAVKTVLEQAESLSQEWLEAA